jgi:hypothetical protein
VRFPDPEQADPWRRKRVAAFSRMTCPVPPNSKRSFIDWRTTPKLP